MYQLQKIQAYKHLKVVCASTCISAKWQEPAEGPCVLIWTAFPPEEKADVHTHQTI